ncbi:hypothetical protein GQ53DRAFT_93840 [Thozetella sp. PMI_491]|nr:hypothetical protein GQ53DRAFT_93840 [Thozetella sp. PMI_491]
MQRAGGNGAGAVVWGLARRQQDDTLGCHRDEKAQNKCSNRNGERSSWASLWWRRRVRSCDTCPGRPMERESRGSGRAVTIYVPTVPKLGTVTCLTARPNQVLRVCSTGERSVASSGLERAAGSLSRQSRVARCALHPGRSPCLPSGAAAANIGGEGVGRDFRAPGQVPRLGNQ